MAYGLKVFFLGFLGLVVLATIGVGPAYRFWREFRIEQSARTIDEFMAEAKALSPDPVRLEQLALAAIAAGQRAVASHPADPERQLALARVYLELERWGVPGAAHAARRTLEQAVALDPNFADARYFLGLSYERLGRPAEALAEFLAIQRFNPDHPGLDQIISNLEQGRDIHSLISP